MEVPSVRIIIITIISSIISVMIKQVVYGGMCQSEWLQGHWTSKRNNEMTTYAMLS